MASRMITSLLAGLSILALTWRAGAQVEVSMEDRVEVFLGETAQITCMFTSSDGIGGIMIQWSVMHGDDRQRIYYRDSTMEIYEAGTALSGRVSVNGTGASREVVLTISDVQLTDERVYICSIKSLTDGEQEGRTRLQVYQTPQLPSIEGAITGISVYNEKPSKIGSCEVRNGYPRPNITWYRDQTPLQNSPDGDVGVVSQVTRESSGLFTVNSELQLRVVKEDQDARFYCEVSYYVPGGTKMTETSRINITVHYPTTAISVWVESPTGLVKEGDTVEIRCRGNGNPQPPLTFYKNEETLSSDSVDRVVLRDVTRLDRGTFKCVSLDLDTYEESTGEVQLLVHYLDPARLDPQDSVVMQLGEEMSVTCNALSSLNTHTAWYKEEEQVAEGHVLKLKAGLEAGGTYTCVVSVPSLDGLETSSALHVYVQAPPVISDSAETVLEENVDRSVNLTCHATGFPAPKITWTASDFQDLNEVTHTMTTGGGVTSVVKVRVTSDLTVHCNAASQQGNAAKVFKIKAIPQTTSSAPTTSTSTSSSSFAQTTSTTSSSSTTTNTIEVLPEPGSPPKRVEKEGSGVIIAVIIVCILLLAVLGSVLYFLYKKGRIPCGRSGKQDLTKEKSSKDNIVVEMKSENTEDSVLLQGVNGEKKPPSDQ